MPAEVTFLVLGAGIGFVAGVSPGPVLTLVVGETLRGGWLRGAAVAAGPLLADGPILALALVLIGRLPGPLVPALSLTGGVFLLYLAITTLLHARTAERPIESKASARGGLLRGLLARGLSPHPYRFWFLVGAPTLMQAGLAGSVAFLVGYYTTIVGSNVGLAVILHRWIELFSVRVYRTVLVASGIILAVYAMLLLGRGAQTLSDGEA